MFPWRENARMKVYACAGSCESAHFAHARKHFFASRHPHENANNTVFVEVQTTLKSKTCCVNIICVFSLFLHLFWLNVDFTALHCKNAAINCIFVNT